MTPSKESAVRTPAAPAAIALALAALMPPAASVLVAAGQPKAKENAASKEAAAHGGKQDEKKRDVNAPPGTWTDVAIGTTETTRGERDPAGGACPGLGAEPRGDAAAWRSDRLSRTA
jgi:hypothetical protein